MKFAITALFLLGAVSAIPSEEVAAKQGACDIQCAFWYSKCYRRPWAYTCDDTGKFVRRGWNPDCDKNCWCKCDAN
ncbi:hypothetical protein FGRMN_8598 [Fusarium graminum]|nr:hypothetical protein FGRMN_8598 [Fusarium graminum]